MIPGAVTYNEPTQLDRQYVPKGDLMERRRRYLMRWVSLKAERSRQWGKWIDLTDYIMPERGRFLTTDHNFPKFTSKIMNNVPTRSARALSAGLMSGITSPARPWFNLATPDPDLTEFPPVKAWLYSVAQRMRQVLTISGWYKAAAMGIYPDLVTYGTAACLMEEDDDKVVRFVSLPQGSYAIAQDGHGKIDCLMYEEPWTVAELVKEFGWDKVSGSVRSAYNGGLYEQYVVVLRTISPNEEFLPGAANGRNKKWGSAYLEIGGLGSAAGALLQPSADPAIGFLRLAGYDEFPVLAPRWATTGRDVYGTGPGHDALPDAKQLMTLEKRYLLGLAKGVNPPMLIPDTMRLQKLSMLPGDPVYVPAGITGVKIEPAQVVHHEFLGMTAEKIQRTENRIGQAFFADLVMMLIDDERKQPSTAEEVRAKQQEKMLQLGPVLENLNDECLAPMITRLYAIMARRGMVPQPPKEMRGVSVKVDFISILAQAQKLIGTGAKERLVQFIGQVAQLGAAPGEATDMISAKRLITRYADDLGVPPDVMATDEEMQQAQQARQKAQQAAQQNAAMESASNTAKNLGGASTDDGTMLGKLVQGQAGPAAAAQAGV